MTADRIIWVRRCQLRAAESATVADADARPLRFMRVGSVGATDAPTLHIFLRSTKIGQDRGISARIRVWPIPRGGLSYRTLYPPSTTSAVPVVYAAAPLHRYAIAVAISCGSAKRPSGI